MLERCESEFRSGSMLLYALESLLRLAEVHLVAGSPDIAEQLARRALGEAPAVARRAVIEARAERMLGLLSAARGDLDSARGHLDSAARTCHESDLRFELALALAARADIVGDDDSAPEAARIFHDLGVVKAGRPNGNRYWLPGVDPPG
jgi:ATP/maltotriose-dependent transcriptional regulator MalT